VVVVDLRQTTECPQLTDTARRFDVASVAGIPMAFDGRAVGSLNIYDDRIRDWTDRDLMNLPADFIENVKPEDFGGG
jgi:GAF domain-containing protein